MLIPLLFHPRRRNVPVPVRSYLLGFPHPNLAVKTSTLDVQRATLLGLPWDGVCVQCDSVSLKQDLCETTAWAANAFDGDITTWNTQKALYLPKLEFWPKFLMSVDSASDYSWRLDGATLAGKGTRIGAFMTAVGCKRVFLDDEAYGVNAGMLWIYDSMSAADRAALTFNAMADLVRQTGFDFFTNLLAACPDAELMITICPRYLALSNSAYPYNTFPAKTSLHGFLGGLEPYFVIGMLKACTGNSVIHSFLETNYYARDLAFWQNSIDKLRVGARDAFCETQAEIDAWNAHMNWGGSLYAEYQDGQGGPILRDIPSHYLTPRERGTSWNWMCYHAFNSANILGQGPGVGKWGIIAHYFEGAVCNPIANVWPVDGWRTDQISRLADVRTRKAAPADIGPLITKAISHRDDYKMYDDFRCASDSATGSLHRTSTWDHIPYSGTDLVVDAVDNKKVTSATHNFVAADVDRFLTVTGGVGWTFGFYRVDSVASNAATLVSSPAPVGTTGGSWILCDRYAVDTPSKLDIRRNPADLDTAPEGCLYLNGGKVTPAHGDPGVCWSSKVRAVGTTLCARIQAVLWTVDALSGEPLSWFRTPQNNYTLYANMAAGIHVSQDGQPYAVHNAGAPPLMHAGVIAPNTDADFFLYLRAVGAFYLMRYTGGPSDVHPMLLFAAKLDSSATLYPASSNRSRVQTDKVVCVTTTPGATIVPVASDAFTRANGAIGNTDGNGQPEAGGSGLAWTTQGGGTWDIATNKAHCSALSGGLAMMTVDCGTPDVLVKATLARVAGSVGILLRYQDSGNYLYLVNNGTNILLVERIANVETTKVTGAATVLDVLVQLIGSSVRLWNTGTNPHADVGAFTTAITSGNLFGLYGNDITAGNTVDDFAVWAAGSEGQYDGLLSHLS